jgi:glycosyltransferase involved in cell wall biosynthesis
MNLRIAVDADNLYRFAHRGIQKTLVTLYCRLAAAHPGWEFILFRQVGQPLAAFAAFPNIIERQIDIKGDSLRGRINLWEQVRLPVAAWLAGADVLHSPSNTGPAFCPVPLVLTIHDLTPVRFAPDSDDTRRWYGRVRKAAHRAAAVITPSQAVADDVARSCGVDPSRLTVAHWAVNDGYKRTGSAAEILALYQQDPATPFVLVFGSKNRRKNLSRILEAWAVIEARLRDQWRLLVIGVEDDVQEVYREQARRLKIDDRCRIHGAAPEAHVPVLLSAADVLCYASLSEGFGLPIIEAFACGTSVLTSSVTSLPEVAGEAAVLVDPTSTADIAAGLAGLMADEAVRGRLVSAGERRLEFFSWERCLSVHTKVFERAAGRREMRGLSDRQEAAI